MPESRPEPDLAADPDQAEPDLADPDPAAGPADDDTGDEPQFTNRAARRAKGARSASPQSFAKGQRPVGRGAVQSPRQYGTRRSG